MLQHSRAILDAIYTSRGLVGCWGRLMVLSLLLFLLTEPLRLSVSFNGLTRKTSEDGFVLLVRRAMEVPGNVPAIASLVTYGDNGLRKALREACFEYSQATLDALTTMFGRDPTLPYVFLSAEFLEKILILKGHLSFQDVEMGDVLALRDVNESLSLREHLERYEQSDPRGRWWSSLMTMSNKLRRIDVTLVGDSFLRLGMLEMLVRTNEHKLVQTYTRLSATKHDDPVKKMWSLYGLMRIVSSKPARAAQHDIVRHFENVVGTLRDEDGFESVVRILGFWLCAFAEGQCGADEARAMLNDMLQGPNGIGLEENDPVYVKAMVVIVFGSPKFAWQQQRALVDRLVHGILPRQDDLDFSNLLWHSALFEPCERNSECLNRIIATPAVRARLLAIPPYRPFTWGSLLLATEHGIAYTRRWFVSRLGRAESHALDAIDDDRELLNRLYELDQTTHLATPTLGGMPTRQKLKSLLATLLSRSSLYLRVTVEGEPRRVWLSFARQPAETLANFKEIHGFILLLVLRLRMHYESEDEGGGVDDNDNGEASVDANGERTEVTYDLCTEVLSFVRRFSGVLFVPTLFGWINIVYPILPGEDKRSRPCAVF